MFNWSVRGESITYSSTLLSLLRGDKITVTITVTPHLSNAVHYFNIGLRHNVSGTFEWANNLMGTGTQTYSRTWTMASGGSFSFAIENLVSFEHTFSGKYEVYWV